jgi:uncharacterized RDD family membrane protein YckC
MGKDKGKDIGARLGSMILDHMIMTFIAGIGGGLIAFVIIWILYLVNDFDSFEDIIPLAIVIASALIYPIYFSKDAIGGKSPAKRIIGLIIVNHKTNEVASPARTVVRNCTLFFWPIEALFVLFSPDRRLGDFIAGTRVIQDTKELKRKPKLLELVASFLLAMLFMIPLLWFLFYVGMFYFPS